MGSLSTKPPRTAIGIPINHTLVISRNNAALVSPPLLKIDTINRILSNLTGIYRANTVIHSFTYSKTSSDTSNKETTGFFIKNKIIAPTMDKTNIMAIKFFAYSSALSSLSEPSSLPSITEDAWHNPKKNTKATCSTVLVMVIAAVAASPILPYTREYIVTPSPHINSLAITGAAVDKYLLIKSLLIKAAPPS